MNKKPPPRDGRGRTQHAGRVTLRPCPQLEGGRLCEPINRVSVLTASGRVKEYCSCTCGRRFRANDENAPQHLIPTVLTRSSGATSKTRATSIEAVDPEQQVPLAAVGVVPVGTPVLHSPAGLVGEYDDDVRQLVRHMMAVMVAAPGIGLAATQVGVALRLFVHNLPNAAPQAILDPEIVATEGAVDQSEGCLSLRVAGTRAAVRRPKRVQVRGLSSEGPIEITADDYLARIFQHEIDHLNGIEYVQRLNGTERGRVYGLMEAEGIDVAVMPPCAYHDLSRHVGE